MARKSGSSSIKTIALPASAKTGFAMPLSWPMRLKALWQEECEHGLVALCVPLSFSLGIAIYFAAPSEPWPLALLALTALLGGLALVNRAFYRRFISFGLLACFFAGLTVPALKAAALPKPLIQGHMQMAELSGFVEFAERRGSGTRMIIKVLQSSSLEQGARVRITSRRVEAVKTGDAISVKARIGSVSGPAYRGGYDFARDAFFNSIVGSGYVMGRVQKLELGPPSLRLQFAGSVESVRDAISQRIRSHINGETGRIADALVTGKRDGISKQTDDVLRAAGVYHILSVSGFHMALVSALVFGCLRGLLALVPAIALNYQTKTIAAAISLIISWGYLMISGAEVATQRSWIMIAVVLLGVMAGRDALSLRTLGAAVMIVLLIAPESLLGPSFQMSFAATLALVSGYRAALPIIAHISEHRLGLRRFLTAFTSGVTGLAMASFFAGLATAPYSAFHFQNIQLYGLLGNLLGAPIIEFVAMPLEIIALLLWPLGFDAPLWSLVGWSIEAFLSASRFVASLSGGTWHIAAFQPVAMAMMTLGLLGLCLLKTRLRLIGFAPLMLGVALAANPPLPFGFIDRTGENALIVGETLVSIGHKPNKFMQMQWQSALGIPDRSVEPGRCDLQGCSATANGFTLTLSRDSLSVSDDCAEASVIVTWQGAPPGCKARILTRESLKQMGGAALFITKGQLSWAPVQGKAQRPWHRLSSPAPVEVNEETDHIEESPLS